MTHNISELIEKYWAGESSLEEETQIKDYVLSDEVADEHLSLVPLFSYFNEEKSLHFDFKPDLSFTQQEKPKVRFMLPKIIGIAASFLLLLTLTFNYMGGQEDKVYVNKYTEVEDPEEALEIAMEALAFLGHNFDKGNSVMTKNLGSLDKAAIIK